MPLVKQTGHAADKAHDDEELVTGVDQEIELEASRLEGNCKNGNLRFDWSFGDGNSGEGRVVTHTYEERGTYEASVTVSCEGCPEAGTAGDTISIEVVRLDLRIQGLEEEDEDPPNEEDPGGLVGLNNDDDNQNRVKDLLENDVPGDDDLVNLRLDVDNALNEGEVRLEVTSGETKVRIFEDRAKHTEIELPKTWMIEEAPVPGVLYLEGIEKSDAPGEVTIELVYENDRDGQAKDRVKVNVVALDLDIDSDNDDNFMPPDRSDAEDEKEDAENDPNRPGKIVLVNHDDDDQDTITDFADGFDRDGSSADDNAARDDLNDMEIFVPLVLELPVAIDPEKAMLRLTYDASDPAGVTVMDVPQEPASITLPDYVKGPGPLRIWSQPGQSPRDSQPLTAGGHFVEPGTYTASELGFSAGATEQTFYVEAIERSLSLGDQRIRVEIDPDGAEGPLGFVLEDAVRLTLATLEVRDAGDANRIVEGGDMAFITGAPRMPQLTATVLPDLMNEIIIGCRMEMKFERSPPGENRFGDPDLVRLPAPEPGLHFLYTGQVWSLATEYPTLPEDQQFFGGDGFIVCDGLVLARHEFRIRGRNPADADAREFIDMEFMEIDFEHLAYAVAKHESTLAGFPNERYHQFELRDVVPVEGEPPVKDRLYKPVWGHPDGWGLFQVDFSRAREHDPELYVTIREMWDWRALTQRARPILETKLMEGDDWLNDEGRVRWLRHLDPPRCLTDGEGNYLPHGQRAQSGIELHGNNWRADLEPGEDCVATTTGSWVGPPPRFAPIDERVVVNCTFREKGDFTFEDATGLKCNNGCGAHYVSWVNGQWEFDTEPNNYVFHVCSEVDP